MLKLSDYEKNIVSTFKREYDHFDRYRQSSKHSLTLLNEARKKTGLSGAWAKVVTIPRLEKKLRTNRKAIEERRERMKFATEEVLFSMGARALKADAEAGLPEAVTAKKNLKDFAATRYFHKLGMLADTADKKLSTAIGKPGQRSPMDYINGYGGRELRNTRSVSEDYRALMDAAEYARLFREHLHYGNADKSVQDAFGKVTGAQAVREAMGVVYGFSGSVDSMLMSARPEQAREELATLRDSIQRIEYSFMREITDARESYPGKSTKMNAAFLDALENYKKLFPGGEDRFEALKDAMAETGMTSARTHTKKIRHTPVPA